MIFVDKARLLKRAIIISWASLALCFAVKILGGNFFEIVCENQHYKALCEYADAHFWAKYLIAVCSSLFCECFYLLAIMQKYRLTKKEFGITLISVFISSALKLLAYFWGCVFDFWLFIILPYLFIGKDFARRWWEVPIAYAMTFVFQLLSLLTKNLGISVIDDSTFISLIYGIDIYIMCILYYLYRNYKKEKITMGAFWGIFMGKPVDKLKEMKAKREKQIAKLNEEIKAIETEIAKQSDNK